MYLVKPSISNITNGDRYLICKCFNVNNQNTLLSNIEENIILKINGEITNKNVHINSLIDNELPYYLLNKLEESNLVIGQQEIDAYDQIINISKNKSCEDKLESLKRNHIQKCIQWCEKNQIPHNKFTDKINIFLNTKRRECEEGLKYLETSI